MTPSDAQLAEIKARLGMPGWATPAVREDVRTLLAALREARAENDTLRLVRSDAEAELAELRARIEAVCESINRAPYYHRPDYGRVASNIADRLRAALAPAEETK